MRIPFLPVWLWVAARARWTAGRDQGTDDGESSASCGYESCFTGKPGLLNAHIICHSHNDVGWTETMDVIYDEYVQRIYTSVTDALLKSRDRKYVSAEVAFFDRWWQDQLPPRKTSVRQLVRQGQLEFVGGGWVQSDEACTHYSALVDQMSLGMGLLNASFGECGRPRVAWQVDPYGHSRETAALFAQMGLDGVFLGRIHVNDKQFRRSQKSLEFVWNADRNLGNRSDLFASVLPNVYQPPKGFCFDKTSCAPGADVLSYNSRTRARQFIDAVKEYAKDYGTKNVMVTMGGDLAYTKADSWFDNLDRLIAAVNKEAATTGTPVQAFYSTPSCYLRAVNNASAPWPVYTQDFLPYADKQHFYWTGLYSSRPSLKRYARYANGFLQACKQIAVTSGIRDSILKFKQAVATMQHHDAVTGTSSEKVARDYAKMIGDSIFLCEKVISDGMVSSLWRNPESFDEPLQFCHRLNETVCFMTENVDKFVVVAYNPMSHKATHNIRLPVPFDDGYKVQSYDNKIVESQVVPRVNTVLELPSKTSTATNELVFQVEIPQLGASAFHVSRVPSIWAFLQICRISRARSLHLKYRNALDVPTENNQDIFRFSVVTLFGI